MWLHKESNPNVILTLQEYPAFEYRNRVIVDSNPTKKTSVPRREFLEELNVLLGIEGGVLHQLQTSQIDQHHYRVRFNPNPNPNPNTY